MRSILSFFLAFCLLLSCKDGSFTEMCVSLGEDGDSYIYADPVSDSKLVESGQITRLVCIDVDTITEILREHGAFTDSWRDFISGSAPFAGPGERLARKGEFRHDYSATELCERFGGYVEGDEIKSDCLFVVKGEPYAYNIMNFGNFLWGATGYTIGIPGPFLLAGSHAYRFNETTIRPLFSKGLRFHPEFDSRDDQLSIAEGISFARRNGYRSFRKH